VSLALGVPHEGLGVFLELIQLLFELLLRHLCVFLLTPISLLVPDVLPLLIHRVLGNLEEFSHIPMDTLSYPNGVSFLFSHLLLLLHLLDLTLLDH